MQPLKLLLFFLFLATGTWAKDVYHVRLLSEGELLRTYTSLLVEACRHADPFWRTASFDTAAGYWGDGASDGNQGIRAVGEMVFASGVLLKHADALGEAEGASYLGKATAAIRFAVATHATGTQKCPDGKAWGNSWQSAMWAGTLGFGAWLIWDRLDVPLQQEVERVIAAEADRFLTGKPPAGTFNDTKAEENGWNLICLSLAANLFPAHPHAAAWREKAIEYAMNTLSAPQDREDKTLVDGKPVSEWFAGANVHTDFTLENHGFFHPAYVACSSYFLTQTAMHFTYARRPIPRAVSHHLLDVWQVFQHILLPCGEPAYPQGTDWELHGITIINLLAALATWRQDPLAARLEQHCLQYMRAWQAMEDGSLAVPGSRLGFTRHAICAEQAAYGLLAHKLFGPPAKAISSRKAAARVGGVREFKDAGFITHRTAAKFVSFSWKHRIMGLVMPISEGHEGNPHFTIPLPHGLVGDIELAPAGEAKTTVVAHAWQQTADGFETTGTLLRRGGRLKQTLRVTSLGESTVVYQDRVTALAEVTVVRELGVPIGFENDKVTGGTRTVFHQAGETVFDWRTARSPVAIPGACVNVDGRLGVVAVAGSGLSYARAASYHPGLAVCADVLYCSAADGPKRLGAGEEVARRVAVFFVEVDPEQTAALAKSFRVANKVSGAVLRLKLPEGGAAEIPLLQVSEKN